MADQARVLVRFQLAQRRMKDVLEMPDAEAVRMIRSDQGKRVAFSGMHAPDLNLVPSHAACHRHGKGPR